MRVRLRFRDGSRSEATAKTSDSADVLKWLVDAQVDDAAKFPLDARDWRLVSSYPRLALSRDALAGSLEATGLPFEKVDVNLYGSGGFDKSALKKVEAAGGLAPKGYIPVISIGDEVIRESSVCVERVAELSAKDARATSLLPDNKKVADELIAACNALPKSTSSRELTALMRQCDAACAEAPYLAGERFSIADCCLLPFLQRVEEDIPSDAKHLKAYMARVHEMPAFEKTVVSSWWWWW